MNEIITDDYFPGKGCDCEARSSYECGCEGADWTPKEVYDLRGEVMALKAFAESTAHLAKSLKAERDEARNALMKIEDLFIDGTDIYADRENMGMIAKNALEETK